MLGLSTSADGFQMTECAICGGRVHEYERIRTTYGGEPYRFCSDEHKAEFESAPERFL